MDWTPPPEFTVEREPWGRVVRCRTLPGGARHLFSSRDVDCRNGAPGLAVTLEAVALSLGLTGEALKFVRQVHGRSVVVVGTGCGREAWPEQREADVLLSDDPRVAVAVRVADCVPVLIADARLGAVAAVHAGWRGTALNVAGAVVQAMVETFGSRPVDLHAALGPAIGPEIYEVGEEVRAAFERQGHPPARLVHWFTAGRRGRPHLDVCRANIDQLAAAGVPRNQIACAQACTATLGTWFHSHRRDGAGAGRMVAAIRAFAPTPSTG